MALDTNLTPEVVNSYNTYINGNKAIGVTSEISMPTITSETIDVSGTGILGKISAPNIGQFESIEQEITFNLIYSSFVDMLSPKLSHYLFLGFQHIFLHNSFYPLSCALV